MARGYNSMADVVKTTTDGQDLNEVWAEFQQTIAIRNQRRSALADLFTFRTTLATELVPQALTGDDFDEASEYGVPTGIRPTADMAKVGYPHKWYDKATKFTWQFLSRASSAQVASVHSAALEADNKLIFDKVMRRVFNPTTWQNEDGTSVYGFWNGVDGQPPANQWGETFAANYTHYRTSGAANLASADVDELVSAVESQGYGLRENGDRIIVLVNPQEADVIASFTRAGGAKYDAIPSTDAPAFITAETIEGDRPPGDFNGLAVKVAYGDAWVVEDRGIPAGYMVALATGGPNSDRNPLGFREEAVPSLQGLIQVGGGSSEYPLINSYYLRGFGVGTRRRGAGAVMQITANAVYATPAKYA
ncbi:hypothetical protein [Pimelobacter simplex]|uniref:hypothetical protein n=1 Tax=Nocardioides simplex TaxID=2045 RepID=UPI003AAE0690